MKNLIAEEKAIVACCIETTYSERRKMRWLKQLRQYEIKPGYRKFVWAWSLLFAFDNAVVFMDFWSHSYLDAIFTLCCAWFSLICLRRCFWYRLDDREAIALFQDGIDELQQQPGSRHVMESIALLKFAKTCAEAARDAKTTEAEFKSEGVEAISLQVSLHSGRTGASTWYFAANGSVRGERKSEDA